MPEADILRVPAGSGALHVERYGQGGRGFVLLHGFATSGFLWRAVAPRIAAAGHTAYAIDMMGYGESDRPVDGDYSISAHADYVDRALAALRIVSPILVGVDVGGGVAQRLAVARGDRLGGLVLVNSVAFDESPGRDVAVLQRATARFAFRLARGPLGAAPLMRQVLEGSVFDPDAMPDRLLARYLAPYVGERGVSHLLTLAAGLDEEDLQGLELDRIEAPTVIVWGEEDRWLDSGLPERLQAAIPGSRIVRLPRVARLVPEEAPEALAEIVLELAHGREEPAAVGSPHASSQAQPAGDQRDDFDELTEP